MSNVIEDSPPMLAIAAAPTKDNVQYLNINDYTHNAKGRNSSMASAQDFSEADGGSARASNRSFESIR